MTDRTDDQNSNSATKVLIRVRPSPKEKKVALACDDTTITCGADQFSFDAVFSPIATQTDVFSAITSCLEQVLAGSNGSILAYGQTGAGKTYTLFGNQSDLGVVPLALQHLLQALSTTDSRSSSPPFAPSTPNNDTPLSPHNQPPAATLTLSAVEIYNEVIKDLLSSSTPSSSATTTAAGLQIVSDKQHGTRIVGAQSVQVTSVDHGMDVIRTGLANRTVGSTTMNKDSSRSHCIVIMEVTRGGQQKSRLHLVDLAGSERQSRTGAQGTTLLEGQNINRSLLCLNNVVNSLTENKTHIPYRDSKLTRVLQDSLGGRARSLFIVCVSPEKEDQSETLSSLRFAARACHIKTKATSISAQAVATPEVQLERALTELAALKKILANSSSSDISSRGSSSSDSVLMVKRFVMLIQWLGMVCLLALEYKSSPALPKCYTH